MKQTDFTTKAKQYWTAEKLAKVTGGKKYLFTPASAPLLLRKLGILNEDASISADAMRKLIQINHLIQLFEKTLAEARERFATVHLVDFGCGKGYLTFAFAHLFKHVWCHPVKIIGVDSEPERIAKIQKIADELSFSEILSFQKNLIKDFVPPFERVHFVSALHACDTATDDAFGFILKQKVDFFGVAPCCQAELAAKWRDSANVEKSHPLLPVFKSPILRREVGASMTDALRMELMRGSGYEVTATEFVDSTHTPKNLLLTGIRRGNFHKESLGNFVRLEGLLEAQNLGLSQRIPEQIKTLLSELHNP